MSFADLKASRRSKLKSFVPQDPSTSIQTSTSNDDALYAHPGASGLISIKGNVDDRSTEVAAGDGAKIQPPDPPMSHPTCANELKDQGGPVPGRIDVEDDCKNGTTPTEPRSVQAEKVDCVEDEDMETITAPGVKSNTSEVPALVPSSQSVEASETFSQGELVTDYPLSLPPYLEIRNSADKGRGLWATKIINPGDTILAGPPFVHCVSSGDLSSYCSACCRWAPASNISGLEVLKRCTKCKIVMYCDSKCQNRDWGMHKNECAALQRCLKTRMKGKAKFDSSSQGSKGGPPGLPGDALRGLGRIMWKKKADPTSPAVRAFDLMRSQRTSLDRESYESTVGLAHSLTQYLGVNQPSELVAYGISSSADLVDVISRFQTNTFGLVNPDLTPMGVSVSPIVALANHSCEPNASLVFPASSPKDQEPMMKINALKKIKPGQEILIEYIDTTESRESRQKTLKETYGFICKCAVCERKIGLDPREIVYCRNTDCDGLCPHPTEENPYTKCTKCGTEVSPAVLKAISSGCRALKDAFALEHTDPQRALNICSNIIPTLTSTFGLPPSAHPLLALIGVTQTRMIASLRDNHHKEYLDECIRLSAKHAAGISAIHPRGHPVRAFDLAELGKVLSVDEPPDDDEQRPAGSEASIALSAAVRLRRAIGAGSSFPPSGAARLRLAIETLLRAKEELAIGFGSDADGGGGRVGKQVRELLKQLERELGVWESRPSK